MTLNRFFFNKNLAEKLKDFTITYNYFFILLGFLGGNLCGSFFYILSLPPFFIIIGFILCLEVFSYSYYKTIKNLAQNKNQKKFSIKLKFLYLYLIKIGFLFGIFVDAFKVGS